MILAFVYHFIEALLPVQFHWSRKYLVIFCIALVGCREKVKNIEDNGVDYNKIENAFYTNDAAVLLDHFYITLDSSTYNNLLKSEFLKTSFAGLDKGLPDFKPVEARATSFYIRGKKHYIEILGPANKFKEAIGTTGFGFMIDSEEDFKSAKALPGNKTSKTYLTATDTASYKINGEEIIWYRPFFTTGSILTYMHTWYSYYNPEFINLLYNKKQSKYSREQFLEPVYESSKLFQAITKIELVCNKADFQRISSEFHLLDRQMASGEGKLTISLNEVDLVLKLDINIDKSYLKEFHCKLNKADTTNLDFGEVQIKNSGKKSIWKFNKY